MIKLSDILTEFMHLGKIGQYILVNNMILVEMFTVHSLGESALICKFLSWYWASDILEHRLSNKIKPFKSHVNLFIKWVS